ncbi:DUF5694 domain-containing protein [Pseudoduganella chitinolytica]|uniref:DUF5694 domain-containing protein n=1 Tax=Pseudoduganella chitinolytica TaxID=34070 RepID=A0ABY8BHG1_9BURK|nr:DUF5694 domain-containing protein [Pseudoduganella chitinolytica]WEF35339.1 DUF5694 domain-containing protein [Pseudoduganella chitinolytica]
MRKALRPGVACAAALLAIAPCRNALAQVALEDLDTGMTGPRAQVLVLGTVHLNTLPPGFDPAALDGLLARLAAFRPDIVTIETESGEECDLAARHPARYGPDYCPSTAAAQAATGLDMPAAIAAADASFKRWPAQPSPAQRRRLAAVLLAANDRASAYVQWLQLPAGERRAGDTLDEPLVRLLDKLATTNNENYQLAARLAARLGLQRVHAVDNHTGDRIDVPDIKPFVQAVEAAWASGGAALKESERREAALARATDLLPLYRLVNDPDQLRIRAQANVVPALRADSPQRYPLMWVAGWEIRNLRMVANVRETFRERPGARVLAVVGATHKPWFDRWLGQLQGVDVVDAATVLK